jgi:hypothetical protein
MKCSSGPSPASVAAPVALAARDRVDRVDLAALTAWDLVDQAAWGPGDRAGAKTPGSNQARTSYSSSRD